MSRSHSAVKDVNPDKVSEIIRDCAARLILPRFRNLKDSEINTKSHDQDFCTIADTETEAELEKILTALYPGSIMIGEEGVSRKEKNLATFLTAEKDTVIWVADPVDGTRNFKNGENEFAVMLACVVNNETIMGWIYDPLNDSMMFAEKGKGAFMDGQKLSIAAPASLNKATGYAVSRIQNKAGPVAGRWECLYCAGHEYRRLAAGRADFSVSDYMTAWDHLPGVLAVQEAGGCAVKWDGSPYRPSDDKGGLIVASNTALLREVQAVIEHKGNDLKI